MISSFLRRLRTYPWVVALLATLVLVALAELVGFNRHYVLYRIAGFQERQYGLEQGVLTDFAATTRGLEALSHDPNVTLAGVHDRVDSVLLQACKNTSAGAVGQVYYRADNQAFSGEQSVRYATDVETYDRVVDLPGAPEVASLRFDLTDIQGDRVRCSALVINPAPAFNSPAPRAWAYAVVLLVLGFFSSPNARGAAANLLRRSPRGQALVVATVLICLAHPDVVFMGASLRITDQYNGAARGVPLVRFYPRLVQQAWFAGNSDPAAPLYQSDPMMEFMRRTLQRGDSPYWNPYSAAGSLGPETLVDNKFSAFTLLFVLLGGGSGAFNLALILLEFAAAYFMYLFARERLGLTALASIATTVTYLLNGYALANLGGNPGQVYLYVPIALYTGSLVVERPTAVRMLAAVGALALVLSCTFIPTTTTTLLSVHVILFGYALMLQKGSSGSLLRALKSLSIQVLCLAAAGLLLAPIYFPIMENLANTSTVGAYAERTLLPASWMLVPSLFSPTHFFESYSAIESPAVAQMLTSGHDWVSFHFGVVAITLLACALTRRNRVLWPFVVVCATLSFVSLATIFGVPGIYQLTTRIPVLGQFGGIYWWPLVYVPAVLLVGNGVANLQEGTAWPYPAVVPLAILVISLAAVGSAYGLREPGSAVKVVAIAGLLAFAVVAAVAAWIAARTERAATRTYIVAALIALLFFELTLENKSSHYKRNDAYSLPPPEITYLQQHVDYDRTLTLGDGAGPFPELGSAFAVPEVSGVNLGTLPWYMEYFYDAIRLDPSGSVMASYYPSLRFVKDVPENNILDWDAIDMLGVRYVITPRSFSKYRAALIQAGLMPVLDAPYAYVYYNPDALPRAFTLSWPSSEAAPAVQLPSDVRTSLSPARITTYRNAEVRMDVTVESSSLVVLTDNWHPAWSAYIDGEQTALIRVQGTFRGAFVPQGEHEVRFVYRPGTLDAAILTSALIASLLALCCLWPRRVERLLERWTA